MRIAMLLWTRPCCPARSWSRTHDPDGDRCCRGCPGEDSGSRGCQRRRADPVHLGDSAAVGTAHEELGCAAAGALSAWHLDRRLPGGPVSYTHLTLPTN